VFGVNGWEIVLVALIAVFILGPDRMPEYAAKLARGIRKARVMAEGAKVQLKDQLGPEYEDINWRQYDPRQYDPRRIVKEALLDPLDDAVAPVRDQIGSVRSAGKGITGGKAVDGAAIAGGAAGLADASGGVAGRKQGALDDVYISTSTTPTAWDPSRPTPYDVDAT
jgi:sec-independent protein translocase protein TatB